MTDDIKKFDEEQAADILAEIEVLNIDTAEQLDSFEDVQADGHAEDDEAVAEEMREPAEESEAKKTDDAPAEKPSPDEALAKAIEEEKVNEKSKGLNAPLSRRTLWIVFGVAVALALIVPASIAYLQSLNQPPLSDVVVVPVAPEQNTSTEATKTTAPVKSTETSDTFGIEYADWNYQELGRNMMKPRKGPRVYDNKGEVNPEYYDTYRKATGKDRPDLADQDIQIRPKSGTNPVQPDRNVSTDPNNPYANYDGSGSGTGGGGITKPADQAVIRLLATKPKQNKGLFLVNDTFAEVTVGGKIVGTGWFLKMVDGNNVQLTNGNDIITLTAGAGSL